MILIADSGSTKTHWIIADSSLPPYTTAGLNPHTCPEQTFVNICYDVVQHFAHATNHITQLYFYGAGCGTDAVQTQVKQLLSSTFPSTTIYVGSDLMGACRAINGHAAGMVGIMGTGSNICFYDGAHIAYHQPSLGYLIADEGSGNHIGKLLLRDFFCHNMPDDLQISFAATFLIHTDVVIHNLYHQPQPNRYLASFAPFAATHRNHPYIQKLLDTVFDNFYQFQIQPIVPYCHNHTLGLVGGIASTFHDEIADNLQKHGIILKRTLADPIADLVKYHTSTQ